jgi:predicted AlkP superfamily phosphohydrolase/phosphomutase
MTKAWSEGGHAHIFFNMQGREPQGAVPATEYESFQNEMKARLESLPGQDTQTMKSLVFKPQEIYRNVRDVAPDLIVYIGELYWRTIGTVGHAKLHIQENGTGPDGCNPTQHGMFILTAPNCPLSGEYEGAGLLDMAPTLLDLGGYEIPETMQGRSLVAGMEKKSPGGGSDEESAKIVHDRLAGLGYV